MYAHIHLVQTLLHLLDALCSNGDQVFAFTQNCPDGSDALWRAKPASQKSATMQFLEPLAVLHITLAARHHPNLAGIHKDDLDTFGFQDISDGYPVHTGTLHRDRLHLAFFQPSKESTQFRRGCPEAGNVMATIVAARTADIVLSVSGDIDPRNLTPDFIECACRRTSHGCLLSRCVRLGPADNSQ
jgi:hypothetical protein